MKICSTEGCNNPTPKHGTKHKDGSPRYSSKCSRCKLDKKKGVPTYHIYKEDKCCKCGFVPEHPCQLDVDHIDGDRQNNARENLQTLCANCHRLKTHLERL